MHESTQLSLLVVLLVEQVEASGRDLRSSADTSYLCSQVVGLAARKRRVTRHLAAAVTTLAIKKPPRGGSSLPTGLNSPPPRGTGAEIQNSASLSCLLKPIASSVSFAQRSRSLRVMNILTQHGCTDGHLSGFTSHLGKDD